MKIASSHTRRFLITLVLYAGMAFGMRGSGPSGCLWCGECIPNVAVKTNLLHDALLTPDLGLEVMLGSSRVSLSLEGVYAWWSKPSKHRYWRVRGGWLEVRRWLGSRYGAREMSGHHIGIYGSAHDFDFELGGKGVQSPKATFGAGIAYGYSLPVHRRLNIDFSLRLGYISGRMTHYKPQCGTYVCTGTSYHRYFGPTSAEVTLVWFPFGRTAQKTLRNP